MQDWSPSCRPAPTARAAAFNSPPLSRLWKLSSGHTELRIGTDSFLQVCGARDMSISAALCCLAIGVLRIPADNVVVEILICIAKKIIPSLDWYGLLRQMPASEWDHGTEACASPTWALSLTAFPWAICAAKQAWRAWKNREGRSSCLDSFEMENNVAD